MKTTAGNTAHAELKPDQRIFRFLTSYLQPLHKIDRLHSLPDQVWDLQGLPFIDAVLDHLCIRIHVDAPEYSHIPAKGAFIAIANHPTGGLDDLILLKILATVRPDFLIMANTGLKKISNIQNFIIPVNHFKMQYDETIPGRRRLLSLLQNDIPIGIFPAGEVAGLPDSGYKATDPEWQPGLTQLLMKVRVPVLPIHLSANTSLTSTLFSLIPPTLGADLLPAELLSHEEYSINVRIGKPVLYSELVGLPKADILPFLRAKTYALKVGFLQPNPLRNFINTLPVARPIIEETDKSLLKAEILQLPSKCFLYMHQQYQVYAAQYKQIPHVIREIGRLREITYRAEGEGTNLQMDLDLFDQHYHHLFLYDTEASVVVGAYRIGKGKDILNQFGKSGFYLQTLFKMKKAFTPILEKSLELGQCFIRCEYQKKALPLYLLWKGIAAFLEGKTTYRYLIGTVSISNYFSAFSKMLIVDFIKQHFYEPELAKLIVPRKKFRYRVSTYYAENVRPKDIQAIQSLDDLLAVMDTKPHRLPELLKKYLQQQARIIGFNIDPKFSNSLHGFLLIQICHLPDLTQSLINQVDPPKH